MANYRIIWFCILKFVVLTSVSDSFNLSDVQMVNYTIEEQMNTPRSLGNLITDFHVLDLFNGSVVPRDASNNQSHDATLSIDMIAKGLPQAVDTYTDYPKFSFFPSKQWATSYFQIIYKSPRRQEFVIYKTFDRDRLCHYVNDNEKATAVGDCLCPHENCEHSSCEIILSMVLHSSSAQYMDVFYVRVFVRDINDNKPQFAGDGTTYTVQFKEDDVPGKKIDLIRATDIDYCLNGLLRYSLTWPNQSYDSLFKLRSVTARSELRLILLGLLDREKTDHYTAYLLASDDLATMDIHTTTLTLRIIVLDVNDNHPYFSSAMSEYSVEENCPIGHTIATIVAEDKDDGANAVVEYAIFEQNRLTSEKFSIDPRTGELKTISVIDRESLGAQNDQYLLVVYATDHGIPRRSSSMHLIVTVKDRNDNWPDIQLIDESQSRPQSTTSQQTDRSERFWLKINTEQLVSCDWSNIPIDISLEIKQQTNLIATTVIATDPDAGENGTVQCSLVNQIGIDRNTGEVVVTHSMQLRSLKLISDANQSTYIQANIRDLSKQMRVRNIYENGAYVLLFTKRIPLDQFQNLLVRLQCNDHGNPPLRSERTLHLAFSTHSLVDVIRFDRVLLLSPNLDPFCSRSQGHKVPPRVVRVDHLHDVCLSTRHPLKAGESLFRIIAQHNGAEIEYRIKPETDMQNAFSLDPHSGVVSLTPNAYQKSKSNRSFVIEAYNSRSKPSSLRVTIERFLVDKINFPKFCLITLRPDQSLEVRRLTGTYVVMMNESAKIGTSILNGSFLGCLDASLDEITGCELRLSLNPETQKFQTPNLFRLRSRVLNEWKLWDLYLGSRLDREREAFHLLEIMLVGFQGSDWLKIQLRVLDENDNYPKLHKPFSLVTSMEKYLPNTNKLLKLFDHVNGPIYMMQLNLSKSIQVGQKLLTVEASDDDVGRNGEVLFTMHSIYSLKDQSVVYHHNQNLFHIDRLQRSISIGEHKTSELQSYLIKFEVSDQGEKPLTTTGLLYISFSNTFNNQQPINDLPVVPTSPVVLTPTRYAANRDADVQVQSIFGSTPTNRMSVIQYRVLIGCLCILGVVCLSAVCLAVYLYRKRNQRQTTRCIIGQSTIANPVNIEQFGSNCLKLVTNEFALDPLTHSRSYVREVPFPTLSTPATPLWTSNLRSTRTEVAFE